MYLLLLSSSQLPPLVSSPSLSTSLAPCLSSTRSTTGSHVPRFLSSSPIDRPNFSLSIFAPRESGRERIAVLSNAIGGERIAFLFRRFPLSLFFRAAFESRYLSSRFIDRPSIGTVEKLARKTLRYRMRDVSRRFRSLKADILLNFKMDRTSASRRIRNREIRAVFRFPSCFRRQSRCPIVVDALFPDFYSVLGGRFRGRSWFKVDLVAEKPADRL